MYFRATTTSVTTILLVVFACFIVYTRLKNWLDSNIPIMFYLAMIVYTNAMEGRMPPWVYLGFACGLLLRFEFMAGKMITFIKVMELGILSILLYNCMGIILE